jgi:putative addiction module CopG family antidote
MNVSLTKELERLINERVASGRYQSSSEVVREALRLLEEREVLRRLATEDLRHFSSRVLKNAPRFSARPAKWRKNRSQA